MYYYDRDACWNSDYDSTWEDEELVPPKRKKHKPQYQRSFGNRAARDMQNYRHGYGQPYPDSVNWLDYEKYMPNLEFYRNKIAFKPHGVTIEKFHQDWREDYAELEENHNFIQWLFPLRERGVNPYATMLTLAELQIMRGDEDVMRRFLESYRLMLGFYGIKLLDEDTGEVAPADNWEERCHNLNTHSHNNLRITRILKCLGEMGYGHFQAPLVRFFLEATLCDNYLPNVEKSVLDYFMFTVKDKQERRKLVIYAWKNYKSQEPFTWGPVEKLRSLKTKQKNDNDPKSENGGRVEENQDGDRPGVDRPGVNDDGKVVNDVRPGEASEHEDVITSSRNEKQTPEENEKLITEDNSLRNEKQTAENKKLLTEDNEKQTPENNSSGNKQLLPEDNDTQTPENNNSGNKQLLTEDNDMQTPENNSSGNKQLLTEDNDTQTPENNSSGNEKQITDYTRIRNEKQIAEKKNSGKEKLITEDTSTLNEKLITEETSIRNEKVFIENNSSVNEKLITEDYSSRNEIQVTENTSSVNEKQITDDKSLGNSKQITEDSSSENDQMITEDNNTGRKKLPAEDYSTINEQTKESTSFTSLKQTLADTNLGNERLKTESSSFGNKNMTTGGTSPENKTQSRQSGVYRAETPKNEEGHKLLSEAGEIGIWDQILSLYGFCCITCCCMRCT